MLGEAADAIYRRCAPSTAEHHFCDQQRCANQQHAKNVDDKKRAAAVIAHEERELPDIVEPDGSTAGSQYKHPRR